MNKNIYVGRRYIPKQCGDWDNNNEYESLSVVLWQGASYTSKQDVPRGIDIGNIIYWVRSADYNAQVAIYEQNVRNYHQYVVDQIGIINSDNDTFKTNINNDVTTFKSKIEKGHISNNKDKIKAIAMILPYDSSTYSGSYLDFINAICDCNANMLTITPRWWLDNASSRITGYNGGLSEQTVYDICVLAKQKGLKVMLKPHISGDNFNSYVSINPTNVDTFLADYKSYIETLVTKCKDVFDILSLTNEMDNQTNGNLSTWTSIISSVRNIAPNILLTNSSRNDDLATNVFIDQLDILGCNMYVGIAGDLTTDKSVQRASLFTASYELNNLLSKSKQLKKPILVTEVGLQPYLSSLATPEQWTGNTGEPINYNAQKRYYEVVLQEYLNGSNFYGISLWTGFDIINKPNFQTIKDIFGGVDYE